MPTSRSRTWRRAALTALAAAAVTAPLLAPAAPAAAAPGSYTVVSHNVEKYRSVLHKAFDTARARGAQALTLQEVCVDDAVELAQANPGWPMLFTTSRVGGCAKKGKGDVGTLVIRRSGGDYSIQEFALPADPGRVPRLSCLTFGSAPVKHVCSVHLVSEDPGGIRAQQTQEIKRLTRDWIQAGHLVVVGGDFNAGPDKPEMDSMFARGGDGRFVSAHQLEGRAEKTTDSGRHIDYVFFSQNRAASGGLQVTPTGSDHHMLVATTRWG
jgi:endonuclease/exonuclease/phosphatase (EEP) superfamily protein YafD